MNELDQKEVKKKKSKRNAWLQLIIILCVIFTFPFIVIFFKYPLGVAGFNYEYSKGYRVGQVVKLSEKGLIWKSYEGTMGITQSGAYVESWDFSVDNENSNKQNIIDELLLATKNGNLVEIKYSQRIGVIPWRAKTSYLVQEVNILR